MALREIKIEWETFNFKVWCVIGEHRYLRAYVKKRLGRVYKGKPAKDLRGLYFPHVPHRGAVLWIAKEPETAKEFGYVAHEISHAVIDMHENRGINVDKSNDEPFCYSIQHGMTLFLQGCWKQ